MKIKNLFTLAVALLTIATACQKEPDLGPEEISISPAETTYEFPEKGGTYTIELTATVDWTIQGYDKKITPWLSIEPSSGKASASVQTITITALPNEDTNRKADLVFYGNIMNQAPLTITQPGPKGDGSVGTGTVDDPFNVAAAIKYIDEHEYYGDDKNPNVSPEVYVKGVIASIEAVEPSFGNATYVISDGEGSTAELEVYRGKFLNGDKFTSEDQIKVGDEVVVAGQLTRFFETYEFTTGSRIHSLNGEAGEEPEPVGEPEGSGTEEDPYNVVAALNAINDNGWNQDKGSDNLYVKGIISAIDEVSAKFGNATYYISDDGSRVNELCAFRGYFLDGEKFSSADQIKVGDEVVIVGSLMNYNGTYEFTSGNKIVNHIDNGGVSPSGPDIPEGAIVQELGSNFQTWNAATNEAYGAGYETTIEGITLGYYKYDSTSAARAADPSHIRVYKNSVFRIKADKNISRIILFCTESEYFKDLTPLVGDGSYNLDSATLTIEWTGSASEIVAHAATAQVRFNKIAIVYE